AFDREPSEALSDGTAEPAEPAITRTTTYISTEPQKPSGRPRPTTKPPKFATEEDEPTHREPTRKPATRVKKGAKDPLEVHTINPQRLNFTALPQGELPVPKLSYGLDRCLFMQGVYPLQDPRSKVYNFDPYLTTIMPTHEFDFTAIKAFVSSSED